MVETYRVARALDVVENEPLILSVHGTSLAIYKFGGRYFAYENTCAHEGGPVGEGEMVGEVERLFSSKNGKLEKGLRLSKDKVNLVCPWHGIQYDVRTGFCKGNKNFKLNSFELFVDGEDLKIRIP